MMYFVPLLRADNKHEREPVVYHPLTWPCNNPPKNLKVTSDKLVCVTNRIRTTGICVLITHADLHEVFAPFGPIISINIIRNKFRHRNGIAFITYFHTIHAQRALQVSTPIYLKGNRIYTHQAIQKPRNVNYAVKPINRCSTQALLSENEECKNLLLQGDNHGSIPNSTCSSIDSNTKPLALQQSTKSSCTNDSSTETSSTIRNDSKSLCGEESKEFPAIPKSSESRIQNSQEFNSSGNKTLSGVYPVAQGFSNNQALTNYSTYHGINQMTYQLPHQGRVSRHQNFNYSYGSYEYILPETDVSYNPFYVNNHMYQKDFGPKNNPNASESKINRFRQFNSTLYDYPPVVYENKCYNEAQKSDLSYYNKKQPLSSEQMKSQVNVIHKSKMKDRSSGRVNTTKVSDKPSIAQISTSDNKVVVSSNNVFSEEFYLPSSYQKYADTFVESARLLDNFEEQFADAPYSFLQPEEDDDEPSEYRKVQSRLLQRNLHRNTSDSNDSLDLTDSSDDGVVVEIGQCKIYEKDPQSSPSDTRNDSTSNQLNLLETTEAVIEQSISLNKEVSCLDKCEDLSKCTSNQLNLLETAETVIERSTFLNKEVNRLDKSEDLSKCTSNRLNLWETTEAVIEQSTSLNKEVSHLDKSEEIKPKVSDEPEEEDTIVEMAIESGYYLVNVRDVATQFPEYDEKLSNTSTAKENEPTINKDEIFSFTSTSVTSVKKKRNARKRSKKTKIKIRRQ